MSVKCGLRFCSFKPTSEKGRCQVGGWPWATKSPVPTAGQEKGVGRLGTEGDPAAEPLLSITLFPGKLIFRVHAVNQLVVLTPDVTPWLTEASSIPQGFGGLQSS